jgi:hypothetical protein
MNHPITQNYNTQIQTIKEKLPGLLGDFEKYFIFFHKNPEVNEYQQIYTQYKSQLQNLNMEILKIGENIEASILETNKSVAKDNKLLGNKKKIFKKLITKMDYYQDTLFGSAQMTDDYKTLYNSQYYKNIQLVFGILFVITFITILIKKK